MDSLEFNVYAIVDSKKREQDIRYFKDFCDGIFAGWVQGEHLWAKAMEFQEDKLFCTYDKNVEDVFKQMKYEIDIALFVATKYARKEYDYVCGQWFATIMFFGTPMVALVFGESDEYKRNKSIVVSKINIEYMLRRYGVYIEKQDIVAFQPSLLSKKQREEYKVFLQ